MIVQIQNDPLVSPTAPDGCGEGLMNGSFEMGWSFWSTFADPSNSLTVGGAMGSTSGPNASMFSGPSWSYAWFKQTFFLAPEAKIKKVSFDFIHERRQAEGGELASSTREPDLDGDRYVASILGPDGVSNFLAVVDGRDLASVEAGVWRRYSYDLSSLNLVPGTYSIRFSGTKNWAETHTWAAIDNVSVTLLCPPTSAQVPEMDLRSLGFTSNRGVEFDNEEQIVTKEEFDRKVQSGELLPTECLPLYDMEEGDAFGGEVEAKSVELGPETGRKVFIPGVMRNATSSNPYLCLLPGSTRYPVLRGANDSYILTASTSVGMKILVTPYNATGIPGVAVGNLSPGDNTGLDVYDCSRCQDGAGNWIPDCSLSNLCTVVSELPMAAMPAATGARVNLQTQMGEELAKVWLRELEFPRCLHVERQFPIFTDVLGTKFGPIAQGCNMFYVPNSTCWMPLAVSGKTVYGVFTRYSSGPPQSMTVDVNMMNCMRPKFYLGLGALWDLLPQGDKDLAEQQWAALHTVPAYAYNTSGQLTPVLVKAFIVTLGGVVFLVTVLDVVPGDEWVGPLIMAQALR